MELMETENLCHEIRSTCKGISRKNVRERVIHDTLLRCLDKITSLEYKNKWYHNKVKIQEQVITSLKQEVKDLKINTDDILVPDIERPSAPSPYFDSD